MATWLKDLVLTSKLLEKDALTFLRYLLGKNLPEDSEKKESFSALILKLEEEEITQEVFLDDLTTLMGYKELGTIILELYHLMETK